MKERRTIYLSGAITGHPMPEVDAAFAIGEVEAQTLWAGARIINPLNLCDQGWKWSKCMAVCLWTLATQADTIYMLDGWQHSKGAKMELRLARLLGKRERHQIDTYKRNPAKPNILKSITL